MALAEKLKSGRSRRTGLASEAVGYLQEVPPLPIAYPFNDYGLSFGLFEPWFGLKLSSEWCNH